jgi:hypothetical protein
VLATKPTPRLTRHTNATSGVYRPFVIQSISLPVPRWEQIDPWRLERRAKGVTTNNPQSANHLRRKYRRAILQHLAVLIDGGPC